MFLFNTMFTAAMRAYSFLFLARFSASFIPVAVMHWFEILPYYDLTDLSDYF